MLLSLPVLVEAATELAEKCNGRVDLLMAHLASVEDLLHAGKCRSDGY